MSKAPQRPLNIKGADFVLYYVEDLERSLTFYRDFLGLSVEFENEAWKWVELNAGNLTITLCGEGKQDKNPVGGVLALAVDDLHAASKEAMSRNIPIKQDVHELDTCWHLEIIDPDGYTVILHKRKDGSFGQG